MIVKGQTNFIGKDINLGVLIVDDDLDFAESLKNTLSDRGYRTVIAHDPESALQKVWEFETLVAIVNLRLGNSSGIDLMLEMKTIREDIICVVMTDYATAENATKALQKGAYDFLLKPLSTQELFATLDRCFDRARLDWEKKQTALTLIARTNELEDLISRLGKVVVSSREIANFPRWNELGKLLLEEFSDNLAARGGSLFLREGERLNRVHSLDPEHTPGAIAFPLRQNSILARACSTKEPVLIQNIELESTVAPSGWMGYRDKSALVLPLVDSSGDIRGIVSLHNKLSPPFTLQDCQIGAILASFGSETLRATRTIEALRKSEEKYRSILTNIVQGIIIADKDGRIEYVNPAFERVSGYQPEELIGRNFLNIQSRKDGGDLIESIWHSVFQGEAWTNRTMVRTKDGVPRELVTTVTPINNELGEITGFVSVNRDVTYEVELQRQLVEAQKMEAIGTLAGGIAHNFNNLLQVVLGYSELLLLDKKKGAPGLRELSEVIAAAKKGSQLTRQLLTFSRKIEISKCPINVNSEVMRLKNILAGTIPQMIEIELDLSADFQFVNADPVQLEQVLMNLAANAVDAMPDGGKLLIQTKSITFSTDFCDLHPGMKPGKYIVLIVADSGQGMDEETLEHIFEPFFTTKTPGRGTGLGLAMVYAIVKDHEGYINCQSTPGEGTRFEVYLPTIEQTRPETDRRRILYS